MNEEEQREAILNKHLAKQKEREAKPKVERSVRDSGLMDVQTTIAPDPPSTMGPLKGPKHRAMYVIDRDPDNLDAIFQGRVWMPSDYRVIFMGYDEYGVFLSIVVEHESLPEVYDGTLPYRLEVDMQYRTEGKYLKFNEYKENRNG